MSQIKINKHYESNSTFKNTPWSSELSLEYVIISNYRSESVFLGLSHVYVLLNFDFLMFKKKEKRNIKFVILLDKENDHQMTIITGEKNRAISDINAQ